MPQEKKIKEKHKYKSQNDKMIIYEEIKHGLSYHTVCGTRQATPHGWIALIIYAHHSGFGI
jgi:hypothetical protein